MDFHPCRKVYLTSWFMLSVLFLTGGETSHGPPPWQECLPDQLIHSVCVVLTGVRQIVRCLVVYLHLSMLFFDRWWIPSPRIPCHMDLHPGRNIYLTSWFILSELFLTGGET